MAGASSGRSGDVGLLILRIGVGVIFIMHGWPKLMGGPDAWTRIGGAIGVFGITFAPAFWGFMAMFAELAGGLFLVLGFLVRPFAMLMCFTMVVAAVSLVKGGQDFAAWSHPASLAVVFLSLIIMGAGHLDVLELIKTLKKK